MTTPVSVASLTRKQREVVELLGQGLTYKGIALRLGSNDKAIAKRISRLRVALGVPNRADLTLRYVGNLIPGAPRRAEGAAMEGSPLTGLEHEMLCRIADGALLKEIALERHRSPQTVKNEVWPMYAKLGAKTPAHAVYIAMKRGLIV